MHVDSVVFAGGGNRCFWQAGFWSVAGEALALKPSEVAAVSAGSAVACALFSNTFDHGFKKHLRAVAGNAHNLHWKNFLRKQSIFPQGAMYRDAILGSIDGAALSRLHRGPEIRILVSCPPRWATQRLAMLLGAVAFSADVWNGDSARCPAARRIGFKPLYVSVRECATPEALADLIIASSCVPPLTPQARRNGITVFDGGLVGNIPIDGIPSDGIETLVLLTHHFQRLPTLDGSIYVQPSQPIQVGTWDYTDARALQATFDLGRRDGEAFCCANRT